MIGLTHYMVLIWAVFFLAALGLIFNRYHVLGLLMCLELMLLAINTQLVSFSWALNDVGGHVWVFMSLAVAAAEAALGLAIVVLLWRTFGTIDLWYIDEEKSRE